MPAKGIFATSTRAGVCQSIGTVLSSFVRRRVLMRSLVTLSAAALAAVAGPGSQGLEGLLLPASADALEIGAAQRVMTPPDLNMSCMGGYDFGRQATGVHDDLKVRVIALRDAQGDEFVMVMLDMVGAMFSRYAPLAAEMEAEGLPMGHLMVATTHTHSGTDGVGLWGGGCGRTGVDAIYLDFVDDQIRSAVREARTTYQSGALRFASRVASGLLIDTRDPVITDDEVATLQAVSDANVILATMVNYAVHPTILGRRNTLYSGDLSNFLVSRLEQVFGGLGMWATGSEGGIYCDDNAGDTFQTGQSRADLLVDQYVQPSLAGQNRYHDLNIVVTSQVVPLRLENELFRLMASAGVFEYPVDDFLDQNWIVPTMVSYARLVEANGTTVAGIATGPGELFPEVGLEIKGGMPAQHKFLVNMANNQVGYLIPYYDFKFPEDVANAGDNYHETTSAGALLVPTYLPSIQELMGVPTATPAASHSPTPSPTGTPTRTPRITPTRSPTSTPTASPTPTQDLRRPGVLLAGFMTTQLRADDGGVFAFLAVVSNPSRVFELYLGGAPIPATDAAGGVYGLGATSVPGPLGAGRLTFPVTIDLGGSAQPIETNWPYLVVE